MNCANHKDVAAAAYCRTCGKPLCTACTRNVAGVVYCESCLAERLHGATPPNPVVIPPNTKPVVAGLLGFIPGVGAMYNGQFMKGMIHALAFVVLIFVTTRIGIFGILIGFFVFYMVFDAYKTAEAIQLGTPVPDPFGLEAMFGPGVNQTTWPSPGAASSPQNAGRQVHEGQPQASAVEEPGRGCGNSSTPVGAVILIGLGCLFLLHTLDLFTFDLGRFWPVILIVIGGWMFVNRWTRRVS